MLRYNEPLSLHTSFKIGGLAYCWIEPENPEGILEAINFTEAKNKKFIIVGNGTNLLFKDEGFNGAIIHLAKGFEKIEIEKDSEAIIKAGAGLNLAKLVKYTFDEAMAGCEFLSGLPGNLGGAIFMNAGVRSMEGPNILRRFAPQDEGSENSPTPQFIEIKDIILDVEILDLKDRKIKTLDKKDIDFKYRSSGLDGKIILGARLKLEKDNKVNIQDRINAFNKKRDWLVKIGFPNAGSIFKNPSPDKSAGMLIESCGLKGKRIGNAEISKVHANIIVNFGKATANDVLGLIDLAMASVKQKFGIDLELELKLI